MDLTDEDGLPASEVGAWTLDKHERLRKYVDSAHGARRKFASRTYIDLYYGPGRSWVRETREFVDGSPLVAHEEDLEAALEQLRAIATDIAGTSGAPAHIELGLKD